MNLRSAKKSENNEFGISLLNLIITNFLFKNGTFSGFSGPKIPLSKYFGRERGQKPSVREPVRLTLCSFLKHLWLICDPIDAQRPNFSPLAPLELTKVGYKIVKSRKIRHSWSCLQVYFVKYLFRLCRM